MAQNLRTKKTNPLATHLIFQILNFDEQIIASINDFFNFQSRLFSLRVLY